ncbi:hypothetical protein VTN02DRAFT_1033 [Thermoascus thermophilus]
MRRTASLAALAAALLLVSLANALPHDDHDGMDMNMDQDHGHGDAPADAPKDTGDPADLSYFAYGQHSGMILAHIILMVLSWCFILPVGVMLSVARSRLALPTQFLFLAVNALGVFLGIIYNAQTPDLYENNAHHKIGWIVTWVMVAQVVMGLILWYSGQGRPKYGAAYERAAFLPVPTEAGTEHQRSYPSGAVHEYRWSGDSGQGTERNSSSLQSRPSSPDHFEKPEDDVEEKPAPSRGCFHLPVLDQFLANRIPGLVSSRALRILDIVYIVIDRIILPFGFIALVTGGVVYGGIFKGHYIFNGLAHFIKGGIFIWYGLLTLGRWMGCWADFGWAWNAKPPREVVGDWKARIPTGEFTESLVIFLYGASNIFLEHLGRWGGAWTATDLEHVSIAFLFFGGGLCGMFFESKRIRDWLNKTVLRPSNHLDAYGQPDPAWQMPNTQNVSLNPMPALVILLLGMMMGSHHQADMTSTMVHKQWGDLLVGFALARCATYALLFIKPPTSYLPARPPTEILASFCLIAGGLIFMMSTDNVIQTLNYYNLDAMFAFTVGMGFTAFVMAWEITTIAIKAWAVKREQPPQLPPFRFPA